MVENREKRLKKRHDNMNIVKGRETNVLSKYENEEVTISKVMEEANNKENETQVEDRQDKVPNMISNLWISFKFFF